MNLKCKSISLKDNGISGTLRIQYECDQDPFKKENFEFFLERVKKKYKLTKEHIVEINFKKRPDNRMCATIHFQRLSCVDIKSEKLRLEKALRFLGYSEKQILSVEGIAKSVWSVVIKEPFSKDRESEEVEILEEAIGVATNLVVAISFAKDRNQVR